MIRAEGFDPKTMSVRAMDGGTTVLVFNEPPTVPEIDALFPIKTKLGGRLTARGAAHGTESDGTMIVYPSAAVAAMRAQTHQYLMSHLTTSMSDPVLVEMRRQLGMTTPKKRRERQAIKRIWGEE